MPLESFSYISSLNTSNPSVADGLVEGDDHLRGIKLAITQSFPNINGACTATPAQLSNMDQTLAVTGEVKMLAHVNVPPGWLECNGQAVSRATYAALFGLIGTVWGAGNGSTTFNVPDMRDRYPRGRSATFDIATYLTQSVQSHTHTASASSSLSAATTNSAGAHGHTYSIYASQFAAALTAGPTDIWVQLAAGTTSTDGAHTHTVSGTVSTSVTVDAAGSTETRPASACFMFIIKT